MSYHIILIAFRVRKTQIGSRSVDQIRSVSAEMVWSWIFGAVTSVINTGINLFSLVKDRVNTPKVAPPPLQILQAPISPSGRTDQILQKIHDKMPPLSGPIFQVIEPTAQKESKVHDGAFEHLVGMQKQQAMLAALSSMLWQHWREAEKKIREERRQRVAFLVFTGGPGSGKTAHAKALADYFRIPCVLVNPGNAAFVNGEGQSTMRKVIDYSLVRKSAVILLDEIDVYAKDEGFMAEVRQFVDGASRIDDEGLVFVIGTTNKGLDIFPEDLLHRVLLEVPFDIDADEKNLHYPSKQTGGFGLEQCQAFWDRNAKCLNKEERRVLSELSTGLSPRDLQLWVQKVLIATCWKAMMENEIPDTMRLPTLSEFVPTSQQEIFKKAPAELPPAFDFLQEPFRSTIIEATTRFPIHTSPLGSSYAVWKESDGSPSLVIHTCHIQNKEMIKYDENIKVWLEVLQVLRPSRL